MYVRSQRHTHMHTHTQPPIQHFGNCAYRDTYKSAGMEAPSTSNQPAKIDTKDRCPYDTYAMLSIDTHTGTHASQRMCASHFQTEVYGIWPLRTVVNNERNRKS